MRKRIGFFAFKKFRREAPHSVSYRMESFLHLKNCDWSLNNAVSALGDVVSYHNDAVRYLKNLLFHPNDGVIHRENIVRNLVDDLLQRKDTVGAIAKEK